MGGLIDRQLILSRLESQLGLCFIKMILLKVHISLKGEMRIVYDID